MNSRLSPHSPDAAPGPRTAARRLAVRPRAARAITALALAALATLGALAAPAASAQAPDFLTRFSANGGVPGPGAGELNNPRAIAANPDTGHVYISENINRISEFTAWGEFVRAWGWDVAPDGQPGDTPADEFEVCGPATPQESPDPGLCQSGVGGSGSGQLNSPSGIAVDASGNVYVYESGNARIHKFDLTGSDPVPELLIGADVIATGTNNDATATPEEQRFTVNADSGSFTLTFEGETTDPIDFDADVSTVKSALEALSSIGGAHGSVSVTGGPGGAGGSSPYEVTFQEGVGGYDVPQLEIDPSGLGVPVGTVLTCTNNPFRTDTSTYQWLSNGAPASGSGANTDTYETVAADAGKPIQCQVKKENATTGAAQASPTRVLVSVAPSTPPPLPPDRIEIPTPTSPTAGTELTCDPQADEWTGVTEPFAFQWHRDGAPIAGATGQTYTLAAADVPGAIQCAVTGSNAGGSVVKFSRSGTTSPAPANFPPLGELSIERSIPVGTELTCPVEANTDTLTYQWLSNGAPASGPGANTDTYETVAADAGKQVQCEAKSTLGTVGSAQASAPKTIDAAVPSPELPLPPLRLTAPSLASAGSELTCGPRADEWLNVTEPFAFQWHRNGAPIAAATGQSYTVQGVDESSVLQCAVTGSNANGSAVKYTEATQIFPIVDNPTNANSGGFPQVSISVSHPLSSTATTTQGLSVAEICVPEDGDICKAGVAGTDPGQLGQGGGIAYSATEDKILVGDTDRIQKFNLDGTYDSQIDFEGDLAAFAGERVRSLDVDSAGNIYFALQGLPDVYKISPTGVPLAPGMPGSSAFKAEGPWSVAVDSEGSVYVLRTKLFDPDRVLKYDPAGTKLIPSPAEEAAGEFFPFIPSSMSGAVYRLNAIATNHCTGSDQPGNLYVAGFSSGEAWVDAYGTGPIGCEPPPLAPPVIADTYATSVALDSATLKGEINPKFFDDTTYQVQWGTSPCSGGGCAVAPASPELLSTQIANKILKTGPVELEGLEPGTTYHYRFVADSSGGGPTFGPDRIFRTFNTPEDKASCANDSFRAGPGAELPDCRAYERVSPAEKAGGEAAPWQGGQNQHPRTLELDLSDSSGSRFTFTSKRAFVESASAPAFSQYLAERSQSGWASKAITPPSTLSTVPATALIVDNPLQLFSEDLCTAWMRSYSAAPLTEDAVPGYANIYRRDVCAQGPYEALTTVSPPNRDPDLYAELRVHGASADGSHAVFGSNDKLHPDAPAPTGSQQQTPLLYEHTPAGLRFVCYLPNGDPVAERCGAGTSFGGFGGYNSSTHNAVSDDGSVIYWSAFSGFQGAGSIYARLGGTETVAVSGQVATGPALYWTASPDGSRALFSFDSGAHAGELYEFDLATESATLLATGVLGPMGASEDATRVYFASEDDLDGGGPGATGDNNLYLYDSVADTTTFIIALARDDTLVPFGGTAPIAFIPFNREATVSADGLHATFSAVAPDPSGYENLDTESGERVREIYRYDAAADDLRCISCNPTGARPISVHESGRLIAARIQGWETNGHSPRVISNDGSRVFFESIEALVPRDVNETWDVYQWSEPGTGTCTVDDPTYGDASGGCVDLLSAGESPDRSNFLDATPDGSSAFFSTRSQLVSIDTDSLSDVYAARVGGGFAQASAPAPCEGEGCRGASPAAPGDQGAGSAAFVGPPNSGPTAADICGPAAAAAKRGLKATKRLRERARVASRAARRATEPRRARALRAKARRQAKAAKRRSGAAKRQRARAKRCRTAIRSGGTNR